MNGKRKRNWNYEVDEWWKFVQVTGLFGESCDSNTGKMVVNILHYGLKGRFWRFDLYFNTAGNYSMPFLGQINSMIKW